MCNYVSLADLFLFTAKDKEAMSQKLVRALLLLGLGALFSTTVVACGSSPSTAPDAPPAEETPPAATP